LCLSTDPRADTVCPPHSVVCRSEHLSLSLLEAALTIFTSVTKPESMWLGFWIHKIRVPSLSNIKYRVNTEKIHLGIPNIDACLQSLESQLLIAKLHYRLS